MDMSVLSERIVSLMRDVLVTAYIDDTVEQVERIMDRHRLSFVLVVDSGRFCFGIIRRRDLHRFHDSGLNPRASHAWEVCTSRMIDVSPDTPIEEAAEMLRKRNAPVVVTDHGILRGIVSARDFVTYAIAS